MKDFCAPSLDLFNWLINENKSNRQWKIIYWYFSIDQYVWLDQSMLEMGFKPALEKKNSRLPSLVLTVLQF